MASFAEIVAESFYSTVNLVWDLSGTIRVKAKREPLADIYQTYQRREQPNIERLGYQLEGPQRVDPYVDYTLRRVGPSGLVS